MIKYISYSVEETEKFAAKLAKNLKSGDVIAFQGGMGAGKTAFTRGLTKGLGVKGEVSSPTFSLVNEYQGILPIYHFDMYRISTEDDLYFTGFFDYLEQECIIIIEWSEKIEEFLPSHTIYISLDIINENTREITVDGDDRFEHYVI